MKKFFNYFSILTLTICLTNMGKKLIPKTEIRMKKFGKMNCIFEFFISKVGFMTIYMKI